MMALCKKASVQQEVTTTPASSQRSTQDVSESSHPKLDWMIQWMQESGPIFQEFARQNNIQAHESEEEGKDEENDGSEEMDFEEGD
ncbi:hypothetical protein Gohar_006650 [Gossypium harknessii]|uniref:Uncharacterized protein n=1 Tax=Gossypium harknessii TaxID=34285 RepID=A0A7J9GEP2_9ROSI|nr:hypothetical protein [Gossypium harknessii]